MTTHISNPNLKRRRGRRYRTGWAVVTATFRIVGRIVRGTLAATVLLALVGGLPWALMHFVGWPFPNHVLTWDELQAVLLAPMTPEFLISVLACVLWLLWARFTFDVVAAIPDVIRAVPRPSYSRRGPLHAVAGVLISAIVVSVLSGRTTTSPRIVAAEFVAREPTPAATVLYTSTSQAADQYTASAEIVRHPERGVHDSLWRIAERCLGDGARWPEIWALNQNAVQVDGRVFTTPNLIYPGWELLLPASMRSKPDVPVDELPAPQDLPNTGSPGHDPDEQPHSPQSQAPEQPLPTAPAEPAHPMPDAPPGISTSTGAFVSLGLAALVTIALMTIRLRRRRRYRPGVSELDDPGGAPVVRALRIAHDAATAPLDDDAPLAPGQPHVPDLETRDRAQATALAVLPAQDETVLGVRDGQAVALHIARTQGLGLIGLGAHAAARALIVSVLARTSGDAQVVIPVGDVRAVFGGDLPPRLSPRLRVVDSLTEALDVLEADLLTRTRRADYPDRTQDPHQDLLLVATSTADTERRTQAILDNGSAFNVAGILLGQWRAGGTVRIRDDGTVGAASPNLAGRLSDARLFTLPSKDAEELLALLSDANAIHEPTADEGDALAKATALGRDYEFVLAEPADDHESTPETTVTSSIVEDGLTPPAPGDVQEQVSTTDAPLLNFQVLGRLRLTRTGTEPADIIDAIAPRQREILVYLALHRAGCRRESLTTALWPDAPGDRPYNSFHATLSQLRSALRKATGDAIPDVVVNDDGHYQLSMVAVDLWQLHDVLTACRHAPDREERMAAMQRITELYRGDLADGIAADWIDAARESLRREVLEALSATIRTVDDDPEQMLALLETARGMDPYNEVIYRDLMRVQARLGQHDSIPRTLGLLTRSLAELDQRPTRDTLGLADVLRRMPAGWQRGREAS